MQTTASASITPPDNILDTTPTYAQLHQARQEDYDLLLSLLRDSKIPPEYLADTLIKPRPLSPMAQDNERGQIALQALIKDPDYRALCQQLKASYSYLKVTIVEGRGVYETLLTDKATTLPLVLTGQPKWSAWITTIDQAAQTLGGQIRFDGLVTVSRMATYYGLTPWDPKNTTEHLTVIRALEEKLARHSPRFEGGIDIDSLYRRPTLSDRNTLKTIRNALPPDETREITAESIVRQLTDSTFIKVIQQHLPDAKVQPIDYLAGDLLNNLTPQTLRESPSAYLEKILNTDKAQALGNALLKALDWYASKPDEETSPDIRIKLVAKALRLWCSRVSDQPGTLVGYNLNQHSNWGKSYQTLQTEFESHLLESGRALSTNEAILLGRVFISQFPIEFQVQDIPSDLAYRSSVVWVNFIHGVNLAYAVDPLLLQLLKFQQLVDLPISKISGASVDDLNFITLTRLRPTVEWAITNGVIRERTDASYTKEEIERSVSALDDHAQALSHAVTQLDKDPPKRLELAKQEMATLLGPNTFISDGFKLLAEPITWANSFFDVPTLKSAPTESFSFLDVYASGMFDQGQKWYRTTPDGKQRSTLWIRLDGDRKIQIHKNAIFIDSSILYSPDGKYLPDIRAAFQNDFNAYLGVQKQAYARLITSLLATLPMPDRKAIERGTVRVYALIAAISGDSVFIENGQASNSTRARKGFILTTAYKNKNSYYECIPAAGIIRTLLSFDRTLIGAGLRVIPEKVASAITAKISLRVKTLPFDWNAHETGMPPTPGASCKAILMRQGSTLDEQQSDEEADFIPQTLSSERSRQIAELINEHHLYFDKDQMLAYARGETEFDRIQARNDKAINTLKAIVPFWSSIEDIASGNAARIFQGVLGLGLELASFLIPIGKFVSGAVRLAMTAGKLGVRATLPGFGSLTKKLLIATAQNLNPLDGLPSLLKSGSRIALRLGHKGVSKVKTLAGRAADYDVIGAMAKSTTPGTWKPRVAGDQLATVRGIEDIPLRNTGLASKPDYHLIDPLSGKPYGPKLSIKANEISIGRSEYARVAEIDNRVVFDLPETARVQNIPEVDGRNTLLIDDVPYRLDKGALRRVDTIDASETFKLQTCRVRRAPGDTVCLNTYVYRDLAPTPALNSYNANEGYSPWFGDKIYTPAPVKAGRKRPVLALDGQLYTESGGVWTRYEGARKALGIKTLTPKARLNGAIEFQEGMYGRIKVSGMYDGLDDDLRQVGTLIIESKTNAKSEYLFTQLNATDYYFAEIAKGQSLSGPHRLQRIPDASLQTDPLYKELHTVFIGSIQANNTARIYGVDKVKQAASAMDEIAIPLGGPLNPPADLKHVKVATTPGEAMMFDHRTRMIVCEYPVTTKTWTRTKAAPEALRQQTAKIFNDLFGKSLFKLDELSDLHIAKTMKELQNIVKKHKNMDRPRNIGYAQITRADGHVEVYVSVSGAGGDTRFLPLFAKHRTQEVTVGTTTYINVDFNTRFPATSLSVSAHGKLESIPRTITDMSTYTPELTLRPTSLDSESKLIKVIRDKYPDDATRGPVTVATTMAPCDSCSVVMQQFAHSGDADALKVIWD